MYAHLLDECKTAKKKATYIDSKMKERKRRGEERKDNSIWTRDSLIAKCISML